MSQLYEVCAKKLATSEFIIKETKFGPQLEIRDAGLIYTNFAGKANRWGNIAKNFNVVVSDSLVEAFKNRFPDLNLRLHDISDEDGNVIHYVNIKVNMASQWPPMVTLFTDNNGVKSRTSLTDDTIGVLDRADLVRVDLELNIKESKANEGWAVLYLKKLFAVQEKVPEFGGYYEDFEALDVNPELEAQNADLIGNED